MRDAATKSLVMSVVGSELVRPRKMERVGFAALQTLPPRMPSDRPLRRVKGLLLALVAVAVLWVGTVPSVRAEVSDQDLDVCAAYAQIELAGMYGSPSSLSFINDGRATMERYDGMVDGHYVSTILRMDGVLTPPDGMARRVRVTCLLASVGEPVGLRLDPRP